MKTFRFIIILVAALLGTALVVGTLYLNRIRKQAIPDYTENVDLENMTDKVTVIRDSLAIPHIYAPKALSRTVPLSFAASGSTP